MSPKARLWVRAKIRELAIWAVFVVFAGLYPIWVVYNHEKLTSQGPVDLTAIILKGELLLVAFAIAADATSRVLSRIFSTTAGPRPNTWQLLGILFSIIFLVMAGSEYSTVVAVGRAMADPDYFANQSRYLFVAALLTGGGLVLLD